MEGLSASEFQVLGPVRALAGDRQLALGGPKQRALLAELLLHDGAVVPRDHLVDALWGDDPPESATTSLQVYVHGLRRAVGAERIETSGNGYRIHVAPEELDLARFERLVAQAERSFHEGRPGEAADDVDAALRLWTGPPLADISDQPVARSAIPQLEERRLRALELRNDTSLALGAHDGLIPELERLLVEQPYRERLREQQILALYRAGRQKDALDAYRETRRAFIDELGVEPGPALQELERAILQQDPGLLGTERPSAPQTQLPVPATPLVGRRLELAAVEAVMRREDVRLLTLTGTGGTGKTRLALAVARELAQESRDGAAFVDLSTIEDAELVLPAIGQALGVAAGADVLEHLHDRSLLLVLDNLEQLGPATSPIARLLGAAPRLRVLATSRVPLRLSGEHEYPVPPLTAPGERLTFEELVANDAVRLFAARAQAVDPSFALSDENVESVGAICRRLDGLPLAIELAAARTKVLAPDAIAQRLAHALDLLVEGARDLPPRQRTLRATLDWSYALLADRERSLFARLSVFAGGWTLDHAEEVLGSDVLLGLEALVDNSLVRRRESRFGLLETIREYGRERLAELGEEQQMAERHAQHFLDFAERARNDILAGGDAAEAAYLTVDEEQDNVRGALAWAIETGDAELGCRIAEALRWYWLVRGQFEESRRVFGRLVELTADKPLLRACALAGGAASASRQGDTAYAKESFKTALALFRDHDDLDGASRCVSELGGVAVAEDDYPGAVPYFEEALVLIERLGNNVRLAVILANLAACEAARGDAHAAAKRGTQAIALQRENGDVDGLGVSLANLARVDLTLDDIESARVHLGESLEIGRRLGYQLLLAYGVGAAAEIAARDGEHASACRLVGASAAHFKRIGMPVPGEELAEHQTTLARVRAALGDAEIAAHISAGGSARFDDLLDEAQTFTR